MNEIRKRAARVEDERRPVLKRERTCAPTRHARGRTESTTLDTSFFAPSVASAAGARAARPPTSPEARDPGEATAVVLPEPDVDRRLHDRRERSPCASYGARGEEGERRIIPEKNSDTVSESVTTPRMS